MEVIDGLLKGLPVECPFCRNCEGVSWDEFRVRFFWQQLVASGVLRGVPGELEMAVSCSRCLEEIRPEDMGVEE